MPVLKEWMTETEKKYRNGELRVNDIVGMDCNKKRRRRTTFSTEEMDTLNMYFIDKTMHPSSFEMNQLAQQLNRDREVIRVWFCNKRQALKNEVKKKIMSENVSGSGCGSGSSDVTAQQVIIDNNNQQNVMNQNQCIQDRDMVDNGT